MKLLGLLGVFGVVGMLGSSAWALDNVKIEIVSNPQQRWEFSRVKITEQKDGYTVSGRLNAPLTMPRPFGHVDIAAYGPAGQRLAETTTTYTPSILSPKQHRQGGVFFSGALSTSLPPGSVIKVAFHDDNAAPHFDVKPGHSNNIAK